MFEASGDLAVLRPRMATTSSGLAFNETSDLWDFGTRDLKRVGSPSLEPQKDGTGKF